jgi:hypothetical protein
MGTIDEFKYNFDQGARANRFSVGIHCPKLGFSLDGIRVESCTLPGRTLTTNAFSEYGIKRNLPTGEIIEGDGTVDMTFICDSSFEDRFILEAWNGVIYTNAGNREMGTAEHPIMSYYDEFIGEITINQLRHNDKVSLEYKLKEAYPVAFAEQTLGTAEEGMLKFTVTFAYRNWISDYKPAPKLSALNRGRRALRAYSEALGTLGRYNKTAQKFADRLGRTEGRLSRLQNLLGGNG